MMKDKLIIKYVTEISFIVARTSFSDFTVNY